MGASTSHWMRWVLKRLALAFLVAAALAFIYEQTDQSDRSRKRPL